MEKLSSILNSIKERFTNPIVFSFICSWSILNWQIVLALLRHDNHQIEKTGCNSIFEFIQDKLSSCKSFWLPLGFAILYTLLMPILKNLIKVLYSRINKWGENWNLKILQGSAISIEKFLKLRTNYEERTKALEDVINKESSYMEQYNAKDKELLETKDKLNEMTNRFNVSDGYFRDSLDVSILNGSWKCTIEDKATKIKKSENVHIDHRKYFVTNERGVGEHSFDIRDFHCDNRSGGIIFFVKQLTDERRSRPNDYDVINLVRLQFKGSRDMLVGEENDIRSVVYTKERF